MADLDLAVLGSEAPAVSLELEGQQHGVFGDEESAFQFKRRHLVMPPITLRRIRPALHLVRARIQLTLENVGPQQWRILSGCIEIGIHAFGVVPFVVASNNEEKIDAHQMLSSSLGVSFASP